MTLSNLSQYGIGFQIKVLSSLLTHKEFLLNIHDVISEEYFDNQAHRWIIKEILKYYQKYHTTPSMDVLKVELKKIDNEVLQVSIKEQLREAYKASDEDLKYVEEEFSNDAFFTNIPVNKITEQKNRGKVEETVETLQGQLIIKEYSPGKASMSTIESHIKKCIDQDFKPDLVIIDYVDLLRSKKTNRERKDEIDDIYVSTKALARELNIPVWSVSQVNRAGAKDDVIEGDKAAGSYDKIMITDVAISLSRKRQDKVNGTGRFHIMKNRYGMDGMTFNVKADTSTGHFEVSERIEDDEEETTTTTSKSPVFSTIDAVDKKELRNKFFELNS
jgi:replicative DNA helicase